MNDELNNEDAAAGKSDQHHGLVQETTESLSTKKLRELNQKRSEQKCSADLRFKPAAWDFYILMNFCYIRAKCCDAVLL